MASTISGIDNGTAPQLDEECVTPPGEETESLQLLMTEMKALKLEFQSLKGQLPNAGNKKKIPSTFRMEVELSFMALIRGKLVETQKTSFGGANWFLKFVMASDQALDMFLCCEATGELCAVASSIEATYEIQVVNPDLPINMCYGRRRIFKSPKDYEEINNFVSLIELKRWNRGGPLRIEMKVTVHSRRTSLSPSIFEERSEYSSESEYWDYVIVTGDHRIHVCKGLLCVHSDYFRVLFNGDFKEKGTNEVTIDKFSYEEIITLLDVIYPVAKPITDHNVEAILKLADYFQMPRIKERCEDYLKSAERISLLRRLLLSDRYCLEELKLVCINEIKTVEDGKRLRKGPGYASLSAEYVQLIYERICQF